MFVLRSAQVGDSTLKQLDRPVVAQVIAREDHLLGLRLFK